MRNKFGFYTLMLIILVTLSCSLIPSKDVQPPQEKNPPTQNSGITCGNKVCDPSENAQLCPQDCTIPQGRAEVTPQPGKTNKYALHMNLAVTETADCGGSKCDMTYIPTMVIYLRGDLNVNAGKANGTGVIRIIDAGECKTLLTDVSSCKAGAPLDGTFTISGTGESGDLTLTMTLTKVPSLPVTTTIQGPTFIGEVDWTETSDLLIKGILDAIDLFDKPIEIALVENPDTVVESTWFDNNFRWLPGGDSQGGYQVTGKGGLLQINPDNALPAAYQP